MGNRTSTASQSKKKGLLDVSHRVDMVKSTATALRKRQDDADKEEELLSNVQFQIHTLETALDYLEYGKGADEEGSASAYKDSLWYGQGAIETWITEKRAATARLGPQIADIQGKGKEQGRRKKCEEMAEVLFEVLALNLKLKQRVKDLQSGRKILSAITAAQILVDANRNASSPDSLLHRDIQEAFSKLDSLMDRKQGVMLKLIRDKADTEVSLEQLSNFLLTQTRFYNEVCFLFIDLISNLGEHSPEIQQYLQEAQERLKKYWEGERKRQPAWAHMKLRPTQK